VLMSLLKNLKKQFTQGNTLFYPGCLTAYKATDFQDNYEEILRKIGVEFMVLNKFNCCGSPVLNSGSITDFIQLAKKNLEIFKDHSIGQIITGCPACYKMFKKHYAGALGAKWDIEVNHISQVLVEKLETGVLNLNKIDKSITYHDPCHLGRHMNEYVAPRQLLKAITDDFREMKLTKEFSMCCGAGGGVSSNFPDTVKEISRERVEQALETKADILVTTCPMCDLQLFAAAAKDIEVMEFSEIILEALE